MTVDIRPIVAAEWQAYAVADGTAFGFQPDPTRLGDARQVYELERSLAAFDGEEIVGTTGIFSFDLTVPGGTLPTAGVTWVSVKPTHRRRGILTALMRRQLDDVRAAGEPLAALWASESGIYGRYGYGLASEDVELKIDRPFARFAHEPSACGRLRLVTREEALASWPGVYDRARVARPGLYTRSETWWRHHSLPERDDARGGFSGRFYVQYEEEGEPLGYARYRIRHGNRDGLPDGMVGVQELIAATDEAYAGLWRYLFGIDLIATIEARRRPVDEPLLWMLADPRRLVRQPHDALWLRLVDVERALAGRGYAAPGRVVLGVRDAFCPWNEGRYELEAGEDGSARCARSDAEPEVELDAADLGAAYLGGARLRTLRRAGRVRGDDEALHRADAMFSWDPPPWCPEVF